MLRIGHITRRVWSGAFGARRVLPASEAYALWAETYPPWPHNPLMEIEQEVMTPIILSTTPVRALDVGTGSGRYLPLLASTGARLVVGVDMSMPMLTYSAVGSVRLQPDRDQVRLKADTTGNEVRPSNRNHKEHEDHKAHRVCGDACHLPFGDASFDLISSSLTVGDVADLASWVREVARVVAPGGQVIYSDFHPSWGTEQWRRTFRTASGRRFEIGHFPHTIAEHVTALEAHSFDVRAIHEPRLAEPDRPVGFVRARRHDLPVVVVFHAVKRARLPVVSGFSRTGTSAPAVSGFRACEKIASDVVRTFRFARDVVRTFRFARDGRPKGLHYYVRRFFHRLFSRTATGAPAG